MFAAMAQGRSRIGNLPRGQDVASTAACLQALGVTILEEDGKTAVESSGRFSMPNEPLFAGNSGTTMRLLSGILAGQPFTSRLCGDASLSSRPMERVAEPLNHMGAVVRTTNGSAPLEIRGGHLHGIDYHSPVSSAQIKSAVLLAGVYAEGETQVTEPARSRDHTERMLSALGVPVRVVGSTVCIRGGSRPESFDADLPGDPSSAAFLLSAAVLTGGHVRVDNLLLNETRAGFIRVLERMGAVVKAAVQRDVIGEPAGSLQVGGQVQRATSVEPSEVPALIDELPLVALLGTQVDGVTSVRGAEELRVKETDRIATTVDALRAMGAQIEACRDGFDVRGPTVLKGAEISAEGDHRLAMMLAVAGLIARGPTTILGAEAADVSFPGFRRELTRLGGAIDIA
jgi:3-phosphoshikimate 1-carboxyvinyltransferase